jgi:hypothetical protein
MTCIESAFDRYLRFYKENRMLGLDKQQAMIKAHEQLEESW